MGDIRRFYHSVRIPACDRDLYRYFWYLDGTLDSPVSIFRLLIHLFGGNSSQSACTLALLDSLEQAVANGRLTAAEAKKIRESLYSDDLLPSFDTVEEAVRTIVRAIDVLDSDKFHLAKFISNDPDFIRQIPEDRRLPEHDDESDNKTSTALGMQWSHEQDVLEFDYDIPAEDITTKRKLLSAIASVYDPTNLVSYVMIPAKLMLQNTFRRGLTWDENLPDDMKLEVKNWITNLRRLREVKIPRTFHHGIQAKIVNRQLHTFGDASELVYASMAFLRNEHEDGQITCGLVATRNRLAPLKTKLTIPRMELNGCRLSSQIAAQIKKDIDIEINSVYHWTDSSAALSYIRDTTTRFSVFIGHRVDEIQSTTNINDWRYVPSHLNIADGLSRGVCTDDFRNHPHYRGPDFLYQSEEHWPKEPDGACNEKVDPAEVRKGQFVVLATTAVTSRTS